jgi:alpha-1,3-rhamnosyl/mannosyltransferase
VTERVVAVDAMGVTERSKGNPRSLVNLLRELPRARPVLTYVALTDAAGERVLRSAGVETRVYTSHPRTGLAWELGGSAAAARTAEAALLYTMRETTFRGPRSRGVPALILHVHEPPWYRGHGRGSWPRKRLRARAKDVLIARLLRRATSGADAVVASSQATADALWARMRISSDVVHLGVDPVFLGDPGVERDPYLLHLSSGDGRENTRRVIEAWGRAKPPGFRLVVVGVPSQLQSSVEAMAASAGTEGAVEVLGWVNDERLASLYRAAWALIGPSRYEGFGLEGLEALAEGTPAIVGDVAASREVLGDAALFVDPTDVGSLVRAIRLIIEDQELWQRLHLAGPNRAAGYRWERTASSLAELFDRVLRERGRP